MWIAVTRRFCRFHANLQLTADEVQNGMTKQLGSRQKLHSIYFNETTDSPLGFLVGSWGKHTAIRPPTDVDVFMQLPLDVYHRFDAYEGNGQSALLQEVKGWLQQKYSQTDMRGDGQVVVVKFNSITIEVVPVFKYDDAGRWAMPDTHDGGSWKIVQPSAEIAAIDRAEAGANNNVRPIIFMMKAWKRHCNVPLKSFVLELLVADFMTNYAFRQYDWYWYDWYIRDFLQYLLVRANGHVYAPSSGEVVALGNDWLSRAETAYQRAMNACDYERADMVISAGDEWQKVFGDQIPVTVD